MKRKTFFRQLLLLVTLACAVAAVLTGLIFSESSTRALASSIAREMEPRAYGISRLATRYMNGQISFDSFIDFSVREQIDAHIYVFDSQGNIVAMTPSHYKEADIVQSLSAAVSEVFSTSDKYVSTKWRSTAGIVVGVPVFDNLGRVSGAIFLTKPRNMVESAMRSLPSSLIVSCALGIAIMAVPVYFVMRRFIEPIKQMKSVASAMSGGDFSSRANDSGVEELAELGGALNHLSSALNGTIQDLVVAKDRLHTILSGLSEGVVAIDHNAEITYFNPAATVLLDCGNDRDALLSALSGAMDACRAVLSGGAGSTLQLKRGRLILSASVTPSRETAKSDAGALILLQDISEYERLEQTRRDYVANVSHELRTPIASIRSLAETLCDGLVHNEDDRSRYYGYILRESLRLSRLINDLLELSRLQSGNIALEKHRFDLNELLNEVKERMQTVAADSGIVLQYDKGEESLPPVCSNRDRIEQALVALIDNAIKYASDDGTVTLNAQRMDERVRVEVRNTGHIDENDLPHLFERFYKADASHHGGGTGLGLAITQEVLTRLSESVWAENRGDEAVFTFTVSIDKTS